MDKLGKGVALGEGLGKLQTSHWSMIQLSMTGMSNLSLLNREKDIHQKFENYSVSYHNSFILFMIVVNDIQYM